MRTLRRSVFQFRIAESDVCEQSALRTHGFLRHDIAARVGVSCETFAGAVLAQTACDTWMERLRTKTIKRVAHLYVLALHPAVFTQLTAHGTDVAAVLHESGCAVMQSYRDEFYPDHEIGFLTGYTSVARDRAHSVAHAVVMLFPTTGGGMLLRVTDESPQRGNSRPFRFMGERAVQEVDRAVRKRFPRVGAGIGRLPGAANEIEIV